MKKHYMLFTLLFTLLPFLNSYAEENKALSIPQASTNNVNGYRLQIPETILGDRSGVAPLPNKALAASCALSASSLFQLG